ncbi:MAG: hypothetical protein V4702_01490 [Patescibacteria group bacterium]
MEWNRGPGQTQPANQPVNHTGGPAHTTSKGKSSLFNFRTASVVLLFCITALLVAVVSSVAFSKPTSQNKFIDKSKMQAVFLNGGQVYFGRISSVNDRFMNVGDIYYLRVNQQVQPDGAAAANQDISLVKLGCELHGPQDSMVINQDQIIFWENLKDDGQVAKAVADYKKQNPDGQKCETNTGAATPTPAPTPAPTPTPTPTPPTTPARR